jgi:hypothetical protein
MYSLVIDGATQNSHTSKALHTSPGYDDSYGFMPLEPGEIDYDRRLEFNQCVIKEKKVARGR